MIPWFVPALVATATTTSPMTVEVNAGDTDVVVESGRLTDVAVERHDGAELELERTAAVVRVRCRGGGRLVVRVPDGVALSVHSHSGDVRLSGRLSALELHSTVGDVRADVEARRIAIETLSGDVELSGGAPQLELSTISGDVVLRGTSADVTLQTTSGDVTWEGDLPRRMEARTVSGEVDLEGALTADALLRVRSTSGDVRVHVRGSVGYRLQARTHSGEVVVGERGGTSEVDTLVRGGGSTLDLRTFSGDVEVGP